MGIPHVSRVAASEDGVAHATRDGDVGRQTHNLVATAKDIADAIVAAKTIRISGRVAFRIVDLNMMLAGSLVAAKVVAAKHCEGCAAIDSNGSAIGVSIGIGDEGVLCTAKDGVDLDSVGNHRDVRLGDFRDNHGVCITRGVGPHHFTHLVRLCHDIHSSAIRNIERSMPSISRHETGAVVGIIAVATAIHIANPDFGGGRTIIISSSIRVITGHTQLDSRAICSQHLACNIVATIHRADAVGVDDDHLGFAAHIGHAASAKHRATNHGRGLVKGRELKRVRLG